MAKKYITPLAKEKFEEFYGTILPKRQDELRMLFESTIAAMNKIAIGPYLWIISNLSDLRVYLSGGMVEELTGGLSADEFTALPGGASELSAPEDMEAMFGFLKHSIEYRQKFSWQRRNEIVVSYYFRFRLKGSDKWVVMKTIEESPEVEGQPSYMLAMLMDVSHLKSSGPPMMTIFDTRNRQNVVFESQVTNKELTENAPTISVREREVLSLIAKGSPTKEIASILNISPKTVENHRSNILQKTNTKSSAEAITVALRNGLL